MRTLKTCPICEGARNRTVMVEINGVVDETMTRPCDTCWGDGMVWITDTGLVPWARYRFRTMA